MGLHIEINGDLLPTEWNALAALVAVMGGRNPFEERIEITGNVTLAPVATDADRPAVVVPAAPVTVAVPPPPPADPVPASEALIAQAAATVTAVPAPPPGVEVDVRGFPWDARIHGGTKTKNADGTWRAKRGVEKAMVDAVEAELLKVLSAPVPSTAAVVPPPPPAEDGPAVVDPAAAFPSATPVPAPPAADPAPATADLTEFQRIMRVVVAKQAAKTLTTELTTQIAQQLGMTGVRDLANRPDLIPSFEALLP